MKISIFFFTMLVISSILYAEGSKVAIYNLGSFNVGNKTYLFGDNVNIRNNATLNGKIIDNLPIGTPVTVLEKINTSLTIKGYSTNWYKIRYKKKSKTKEGHVWGGLLALTYQELSTNQSLLLLIGITEITQDSKIKGESRLVINNKEVAHVTIEPHNMGLVENGAYDYSVSSELHGNCGISNFKNIVNIHFLYPACGYPFGNIWIGITDKQLFFITKEINISEAGVFHVTTEIIFPCNKGGEKDTIIINHISEQFDEKKEKYILDSKKQIRYKWNGYMFVEIK